MKVSIEPLSSLPRREVTEYLLRKGCDEATVAWKYYDEARRARGERGYLWRPRGRIGGFLGVVPFILATPRGEVPAAWTCDWWLDDPLRSAGMGTMLVLHALERHGVLCGLGVGRGAKPVSMRLGQRAEPDAGVLWALPLRVGAAFAALRRRFPGLGTGRLAGLARLPLVRRRTGGAVGAACRPGVDESVSPLLATVPDDCCAPIHDVEGLRWQVERSPGLACATIVAPAGGSPEAAALLWWRKRSPEVCRLALLPSEFPADAAAAVLDGAIRRAYDGGAHAVCAMTAKGDTDLSGLLASRGFVRRRNRKPFLLRAANGHPIPGGAIRGLSYLATDLAYRF